MTESSSFVILGLKGKITVNYFIFIVLLIGYTALIYVIYSIYSLLKGRFGVFAPYVPSVGKSKKNMLNMAREELKKAEKPLTVIDLGSGTGSLLLPLAKEFPEHRFIGLEYDWILILISLFRSRNLKNIEWRKQNFMTYDCSNADIVFCYLLKTMQERVGLKLSRELSDSAVVITELYPISHFRIVKSLKAAFNLGIPVYKLRK